MYFGRRLYRSGVGSRRALERAEPSLQKVVTPKASTGGGATLAGVACQAPDACTAVGSYDANGTSQSVVEVWKASTWTVQSAFSDDEQNSLSAVTCPVTTWCSAVGEFTAPGAGTQMLALSRSHA